VSSTQRESSRIAALDVADAVASGRLGIIEGCRSLSTLAHDLVPDWRVDEDFVVFGAVNSETDALPTGTARQYWDSAALSREDVNIERAEALYREQVVSACRNVIKRFNDAQF
jgi:Protein of unknown function (DUF2489)